MTGFARTSQHRLGALARGVAALAACGVLGWGGTASAGEVPPEANPARIAEGFHESATAAYLAGRRGEAIEFWREAQSLAPHWKYAYNLANTLYEVGKPLPAWENVEAAIALGLPDEHQDKAGTVRSKARVELLKTMAQIALEVSPADAEVLLDGLGWESPRKRWVDRPQSEVVVRRDGYVTKRFTWKHPLQLVHQRTITLEAAPEVGTVWISGDPVGASVAIDGAVVGVLPEVRADVSPGTHGVVVTHPGFVRAARKVIVQPDAETRVTFDLARVPPPDADRLTTPGWISVGGGAAMVVGGVVLLALGEDSAQELEGLNAAAGDLRRFPSYEAYARQFRETEDEVDALRTAGGVLLGVGAAAAITGAVFIAIDGSGTGAARVDIAPTDGGAAISGRVRF